MTELKPDVVSTEMTSSSANETAESMNASLTDTSATEEGSTLNDSVDKDSANSSVEFSSEKSSISVIFTDWIPAQGSENPDSFNEFKPSIGGTRPRYYQQVRKGHTVVRPGLGSNPVDYMPATKSKVKKRKKPPMELIGDTENFSKRFKITQEKPASAILNEITPGLQYTVETVVDTPKAMPSFTCSIMFPPENGILYFGTGRSKKLAKNDAAERILETLGIDIPPKFELQEEDNMMQVDQMSPVREVSISSGHLPFGGTFQQFYQENLATDIDFSSDDIININFSTSPATMLSQPMVDANILRRLRNIPNIEENICLALNTIVPPTALEYETLAEDGPPHDKQFSVKLSFNALEYIGLGGSKKKAKANAARQAVINLLGDDCYRRMVELSGHLPTAQANLSSNTESLNKKSKGKKAKSSSPQELTDVVDEEDSCGEYDLNFSDHVCNLVREKFEELLGKEPIYSAFKVLAGVVMTTSSPMIYNSSVIAVATGTKCVEGDFMSEEGLTVNDCHAEILSSRCVRDFLYSQIELFQNAKSDKERNECILKENSIPGQKCKYQLKGDVKFHLYISTSPCGDARIFSPKGIELDDDQPSPTGLEDTHPNKLNRGVLRSKIEAGEGTIPTTNLNAGTGLQTWDSIVSGNALYTMSCSDKVCRWNVLGFQGALLHNLIGTVYYSSITLGSLHHPVHFKRAVYGRVETLNSQLEIPFSVNKPELLMVSREEKRRVKKSPNHAICWSINWSTPEILAASKGRCEPGGVASRLTKRLAFTRFLKLYNNDSGTRENYVDLAYHDAKDLATDYQKAKKAFISFFRDSNLGPWIGKPLEQDSFKVK